MRNQIAKMLIDENEFSGYESDQDIEKLRNFFKAANHVYGRDENPIKIAIIDNGHTCILELNSKTLMKNIGIDFATLIYSALNALEDYKYGNGHCVNCGYERALGEAGRFCPMCGEEWNKESENNE